MKTCVVIPHFEHAALLPGVLAGLEQFELPTIVVDDGSRAATRDKLGRLAQRFSWLEVVYRNANGGKGAALKAGYKRALERGFSHAVQVDADQQHDLDDLPRFIEVMRSHPGALVLGVPQFDATVPKSRLYGRRISIAMVHFVTMSRTIPDPLCGFRGVPLAAAAAILESFKTGDRMDFDPEFAVRMQWEKIPIAHVRTRVSYDRENQISHFKMIQDNALLSLMYTKLTLEMLTRLPSMLRRDARTGMRARPVSDS